MKKKLIVIAILMFLASCAHVDVKDDTSALKERVSGFWNAKQNKEWTKAYGFHCAGFKANIAKEKYGASANLNITHFDLGDITFSENNHKAVVNISFQANVQGFSLKDIKIKEEWINENSKWYHCPSIQSYKDMFKPKKQ